MAAQTGSVFAGCCGIIVETLCINYTMFNKCCGSCESAATCCSSCNCGYDKDRPSRRSRINNKHMHMAEQAGEREQEEAPPSYTDTRRDTQMTAPSAISPMSAS